MELLVTVGTILVAWGSMLGFMRKDTNKLERKIDKLDEKLEGKIDTLRTDMGATDDALAVEIAHSREQLARSLERIARNREGIARNREEIARNREEIARTREEVVRISDSVAEFRGEMRGQLDGINAAIMVLRNDFRASVHGVRAG